MPSMASIGIFRSSYSNMYPLNGSISGIFPWTKAWILLGRISHQFQRMLFWLPDRRSTWYIVRFFIVFNFISEAYFSILDTFCSRFVLWSTFLGLDDNHVTAYIINWLIYCLFSVRTEKSKTHPTIFVKLYKKKIFFGFMSALFVKKFAKFAAGSGVAEVKTILSGIYWRGYLSAQTLFIKVVTLVSLIHNLMLWNSPKKTNPFCGYLNFKKKQLTFPLLKKYLDVKRHFRFLRVWV